MVAVLADALREHHPRSPAPDDFALSVPAGTVHGLLGPNGAGKNAAAAAVVGPLLILAVFVRLSVRRLREMTR